MTTTAVFSKPYTNDSYTQNTPDKTNITVDKPMLTIRYPGIFRNTEKRRRVLNRNVDEENNAANTDKNEIHN